MGSTRKTRKALNMYQALHPRSNVDRLYLPRSEGGKGLLSLEECVNAEKRSLGQYLKMNEDEWLRSAWEEGLIKEDEDPKVYRERTSKSWMDEWQNKPMHGQCLRQTNDLSSNDTWQWLQRGELNKETQGMIMAAQDQALTTSYIQRVIDGTNISPNVQNAARKMKPSIILPVNAQHYHRKSIRRDITKWLELCTGICTRNTKCLAVISGMNIYHSQ